VNNSNHFELKVLAQTALGLLDAGDVTAVRGLLVTILQSEPTPTAPHPRSYHSSASPDSAALTAITANCILGSGWRVGRHELHPLAEMSRSSWADSSKYARELDAMKKRIVAQPAELLGANYYMSHAPFYTRWLVVPPVADGIGRSLDMACEHEDHDVSTTLRILLQAQQARQSVGQRALLRLVWAARESGFSQREIAGLIDEPQTQVQRQLKSIDKDPTLLAFTPREIYDRYLAGEFDRSRLLEILAAYPYEMGDFPETGPDWAYVPGSWDQLSQMVIEGLIDEEELDVIISGSEALARHNG
jgi:hypothetical protein